MLFIFVPTLHQLTCSVKPLSSLPNTSAVIAEAGCDGTGCDDEGTGLSSRGIESGYSRAISPMHSWVQRVAPARRVKPTLPGQEQSLESSVTACTICPSPYSWLKYRYNFIMLSFSPVVSARASWRDSTTRMREVMISSQATRATSALKGSHLGATIQSCGAYQKRAEAR